MGRVIVESVTAEGFGRYGDAQTIRLGGNGPVAVVGDNGAGKSTIASKALCWALYGKTAPERMGTSTRALSGRAIVAEERDRATVTVELSDTETGELWTVERTRTRTKADEVTVIRASTLGGAVQIDDTKAAIERLIGCGYDVFTRTVLRGQGDPWNFAEATDSRKREILDAVSGAGRLDAPLARAKAQLTQERERERTYTVQRRSLEAQRHRIDLTHLGAQARTWDQSRAARLLGLSADVAALEKAEKQAAAADKAALGVQEQRTRVLAEEPTNDMRSYDHALREARSKAATTARAVAGAENGWAVVADIAPGSVCQSCGQVVAEDAPVAERRAWAAAELNDAKVPDGVAQEELRRAREAREAADRRGSAARVEWRHRLTAIPAGQGGNLGAARRATEVARRRLEDAKKSDNPHRAVLDRATEDAARVDADIAVVAEAEGFAASRARMAAAWVEVLSPKGVRAHLSEATLGGIEAAANGWLTALTSGVMSISFPAQKGEKEAIQTVVHTRTPAGNQTSRDLLTYSGGERARVNMAVDLAVAEVSSKGGSLALSLLVLDENVFSGLDENGKAAIVAALHDAGVADVVVIDHDPRLSATLPRTVEVRVGPDGYSQVHER